LARRPNESTKGTGDRGETAGIGPPDYVPSLLFTERGNVTTVRVDGGSRTVVEWPRNITQCTQGRAQRDNRATFGEAKIRRP